MKSRVVIESETKEIKFGFWHEEAEDWIEVDPSDKEHQKYLGANENLLKAIQMSLADVSEFVHSDLKDIWKSLE